MNDILITLEAEAVNATGDSAQVVADGTSVRAALEEATRQVIDLTGDDSFEIRHWWLLC